MLEKGERQTGILLELLIPLFVSQIIAMTSKQGMSDQLKGLDRKTSREKAQKHIYHPLVFLAKAFLQSFDPGLALFHRSHVASLCHLLSDLREYVTVFQAALQSPLHRVLPPDVEQSERLLVRPGNFCVRHNWERTFLSVLNETREVS